MRVKPIASLEPGKTYVIKITCPATMEQLYTMRAHLDQYAPECKFVILPNGVELLSTTPVEEGPAWLLRSWTWLRGK